MKIYALRAKNKSVVATAMVARRPLAMRLIAWAVIVACGGQPVLASAQVAAAVGGAVANRPTIDATANGLPLVQIATPTASGVSRNQYERFNIDARGLVLNNNSSLQQGGVATQLGGYVGANPNLAPGVSARVILNEVTSSNPSQLRGFAEVAGSRAEVIIANPNGITCDGCGFINTTRNTLVTGTPVMGGGGSLDAFRVTGGVLEVTGAGLNAGTQDQVDLIARSVKINGEIWAKNLNIVAGANQVDYEDLSAKLAAGRGVLLIAGQGTDKPTVAVDAGALGSIYANKIFLIGTEAGVGVNSQGVMAAQAGDFTINSAGHVSLSGAVTASNNLAINAAGAVSSAQAVVAQGDVQITGASLASSGVLSAGAGKGGALTITTVGDLSATGQNVAGGNMSLNAGGVLRATGGNEAGGGISFSAAQMDLGAMATQAAGAASFLVGAGSLALQQGGAITANGDLVVKAQGVSNAGSIIGRQAVLLDATGKVSNAGTVVAGSDLTIAAGQVDSTGVLAAGVDAQGRLGSVGRVVISASDTVSATGQTLAAQDLSITAGGITLGGTAQAGGRADIIASTGNIGLLGELSATGPVAISAHAGDVTVANAGSILGRQAVLLDAAMLSNAGTVTAGSDLTISAGQVNSTGVLAAGVDAQGLLGSAGHLVISASDLVSATGQTLAAQDLSITAGGITLGGMAQAGGRADIIANTGNIGLSGELSATGAMAIKALAGGVANAGKVLGQQDILIDARDALENSGTLAASSNLKIGAGTVNSVGTLGAAFDDASASLQVTSAGVLLATGNNLSEGSILLSGSRVGLGNGVTQAKGDASFTASSGLFELGAQGRVQIGGAGSVTALGGVSNAGYISSAHALGMSTGGALISTGQLIAGENLSITGATVNSSGVLAAGVDAQGNVTQPGILTVTAAGALSATGHNTAGASAKITGASIELGNGSFQTVGNADFTATAGLFHLGDQGSITAWGDLTLNASSGVQNDGVAWSGGAASLVTAGSLTNAGSILSAGNLYVNAASVDSSGQFGAGVDNTGNLAKASNLQVVSSGLLKAAGTNVAGGDLSLQAQSIDLSKGKSTAHGKATLTAAGAIDNSDGSFYAAGDVAVSAVLLNNQRGELDSNGLLKLSLTDAMQNARGSVMGGDVDITAASVDNSAGRITAAGAGGSLTLKTQSLNNLAGSAAATDSAGVALPGGLIAGNGNVSVVLGNDFTNTGTLAAGATLSLTAVNHKFENAAGGELSASGDIVIGASHITNAGNMLAWNDVKLQADNDLTNTGFVRAMHDVVANAKTIRNEATGALVAVDGDVKLAATERITNAGTLYAGYDVIAALTPAAGVNGVVENLQGGAIEAGRTVSLGRDCGVNITTGICAKTSWTDSTDGSSVTVNNIGSINSAHDVNIQAEEFVNGLKDSIGTTPRYFMLFFDAQGKVTKEMEIGSPETVFDIGNGVYADDWGRGYYGPMSASSGTYLSGAFNYAESTFTSKISLEIRYGSALATPASMVALGDLTIRTSKGQNVGGALAGDSVNIIRFGSQGAFSNLSSGVGSEKMTSRDRAANQFDCYYFRGECNTTSLSMAFNHVNDTWDGKGPGYWLLVAKSAWSQPLIGGGAGDGTIQGRLVQVDMDSFENKGFQTTGVAPISTAGYVSPSQPSTPAKLTPSSGFAIDFKGFLVDDGGQIPTAVEVKLDKAGPSAITPLHSAAAMAKLQGAEAMAKLLSVLPGITLPRGANGLFVFSKAPDAKYLVETNPAYMIGTSFLSSDYLLNRLNPSAEAAIRLGDGNYEQRMVAAQVMRQTGLAWLDSTRDYGEQYQLLMDNALSQASALQLSFGKPLTAAQQAALTSDIVWMEYIEVDGYKVLAPKVYISAATLASVHLGQIVAGDLDMKVGNFRNDGATITANNVKIVAGKDIANVNAGAIKGGKVSLQAGTIDNIGSKITSSADLVILAKNDIRNISGTIKGGTVALTSEKGSIINQTEVTRTSSADGKNYADRAGAQAVISGDKGVTLVAKSGRVDVLGAQVQSAGDVNIDANEVNVKSLALSSRNENTASAQTSEGFFGSTRTTTTIETKQTKLGAGINAGGGISVNAKNDINLTGAQLVAEKDVTLVSQEGNVTSKALELKNSKTTTYTTAGLWYSGDGREAITRTVGVGSGIVSKSGELGIQALSQKDGKGNIAIEGGTLIGNTGLIGARRNDQGEVIAAAHNVTFTAAKDDYVYEENHNSSGLSGGFGAIGRSSNQALDAGQNEMGSASVGYGSSSSSEKTHLLTHNNVQLSFTDGVTIRAEATPKEQQALTNSATIADATKWMESEASKARDKLAQGMVGAYEQETTTLKIQLAKLEGKPTSVREIADLEKKIADRNKNRLSSEQALKTLEGPDYNAKVAEQVAKDNDITPEKALAIVTMQDSALEARIGEATGIDAASAAALLKETTKVAELAKLVKTAKDKAGSTGFDVNAAAVQAGANPEMAEKVAAYFTAVLENAAGVVDLGGADIAVQSATGEVHVKATSIQTTKARDIYDTESHSDSSFYGVKGEAHSGLASAIQNGVKDPNSLVTGLAGVATQGLGGGSVNLTMGQKKEEHTESTITDHVNKLKAAKITLESTTGDISLKAVEVSATQSVVIDSAHNVNIEAGRTDYERRDSSSSTQVSVGASAGVGEKVIGLPGSVQPKVDVGVSSSSYHETAEIYSNSGISSAGSVVIKGKNDVTLKGVDVSAQGSKEESNMVDISATYGTLTSAAMANKHDVSESSSSWNGSNGLQGSPGFSSTSKDAKKLQEVGNTITSDGHLAFTSAGDMTFVGGHYVGNTMTMDVVGDGNLKIRAAKTESSERSSSLVGQLTSTVTANLGGVGAKAENGTVTGGMLSANAWDDTDVGVGGGAVKRNDAASAMSAMGIGGSAAERLARKVKSAGLEDVVGAVISIKDTVQMLGLDSSKFTDPQAVKRFGKTDEGAEYVAKMGAFRKGRLDDLLMIKSGVGVDYSSNSSDSTIYTNAGFDFNQSMDINVAGRKDAATGEVIRGGVADIGGANLISAAKGTLNLTAASVETTKYVNREHTESTGISAFAGSKAGLGSSVGDAVNHSTTLAQKSREGQKVDGGLTSLQAMGDTLGMLNGDALSVYKKASVSVSGGSSWETKETENTTEISAGNININTTKGDIALRGVTLNASKDVSLVSAGNVVIEAGKSTKVGGSSTWNAAVDYAKPTANTDATSTSLSAGFSISSIDETAYANSQVTGNNVKIKTATAIEIDAATGEKVEKQIMLDVSGKRISLRTDAATGKRYAMNPLTGVEQEYLGNVVGKTGDLTIKGGNVTAKLVASLEVNGDLTIQSLQDEKRNSTWRADGGLSKNGGRVTKGGAGDVGVGRSWENSAKVAEQSGIKGATVDGKVSGSATLTGAYLVGEKGGDLTITKDLQVSALNDKIDQDGHYGGAGGGSTKTSASGNAKYERSDQVKYDATQQATLSIGGKSTTDVVKGSVTGVVNTDVTAQTKVTRDERIAGNIVAATIDFAAPAQPSKPSKPSKPKLKRSDSAPGLTTPAEPPNNPKKQVQYTYTKDAEPALNRYTKTEIVSEGKTLPAVVEPGVNKYQKDIPGKSAEITDVSASKFTVVKKTTIPETVRLNIKNLDSSVVHVERKGNDINSIILNASKAIDAAIVAGDPNGRLIKPITFSYKSPEHFVEGASYKSNKISISSKAEYEQVVKHINGVLIAEASPFTGKVQITAMKVPESVSHTSDKRLASTKLGIQSSDVILDGDGKTFIVVRNIGGVALSSGTNVIADPKAANLLMGQSPSPFVRAEAISRDAFLAGNSNRKAPDVIKTTRTVVHGDEYVVESIETKAAVKPSAEIRNLRDDEPIPEGFKLVEKMTPPVIVKEAIDIPRITVTKSVDVKSVDAVPPGYSFDKNLDPGSPEHIIKTADPKDVLEGSGYKLTETTELPVNPVSGKGASEGQGQSSGDPRGALKKSNSLPAVMPVVDAVGAAKAELVAAEATLAVVMDQAWNRGTGKGREAAVAKATLAQVMTDIAAKNLIAAEAKAKVRFMAKDSAEALAAALVVAKLETEVAALINDFDSVYNAAEAAKALLAPGEGWGHYGDPIQTEKASPVAPIGLEKLFKEGERRDAARAVAAAKALAPVDGGGSNAVPQTRYKFRNLENNVTIGADDDAPRPGYIKQLSPAEMADPAKREAYDATVEAATKKRIIDGTRPLPAVTPATLGGGGGNKVPLKTEKIGEDVESASPVASKGFKMTDINILPKDEASPFWNPITEKIEGAFPFRNPITGEIERVYTHTNPKTGEVVETNEHRPPEDWGLGMIRATKEQVDSAVRAAEKVPAVNPVVAFTERLWGRFFGGGQ